MKKILLALCLLVVSSSLVFAQTNLDSDLYDENGFRINQDPSFIRGEKPAPPEGLSREDYFNQILENGTSENLDNFISGEPAYCFDYYTFGSIEVDLSQNQGLYNPGDPIYIRGDIVNKNEFAITDLSIRARIVKDIPNPKFLRSEIITIEDFFVAKDINLQAGESKYVSYSYQLPMNAPEGEYQILFYAYNNDRFNQSGLSFTNDIVSSKVSFNVGGGNPEHVYLDQTRITLNEKAHNVMAFLTNHGRDEDIEINIPIVNPTESPDSVDVSYTLYRWDGILDKNIVDTKYESLNVSAEGEVMLTYEVKNTDTSAYYLKIEAESNSSDSDRSVYDTKTTSNIRFSVDGYDFPRINSFGVDSYPLNKDKETTLFTCYHNGAEKITDDVVNIKTSILDDHGNKIAETEFEGKISGKIEAIATKFVPEKDINNFIIVSTISSNGEVIDTIESHYYCSELDPSTCSNSIDYTPVLIMAIIILLLLFIVILIKKRANKAVVSLVILLTLIFGANSVSAAIVTDDFEILGATEMEQRPWAYSGAYNTSLNTYTSLDWTGSFTKEFNLVKGEVNQPLDFSLNVNESVVVDNKPTEGYWFLRGSLWDSPPMDGVIYGRRYYNEEGQLEYSVSDAEEIFPKFAVSNPIEKGNVTITSSDPTVVSCDLSGCTAHKKGIAQVTVSFEDDDMTSYYGNKTLVYNVYDEDWNQTKNGSDVDNRVAGDPVVHNSDEFENIATETCGRTWYGSYEGEEVYYEYCLGKDESDLYAFNSYGNLYYTAPERPQLYLVKYSNEDKNGFIKQDNTGFGMVNIWESYQHWYSPEWIDETSYAFSFPDIVYTITVEENSPQKTVCAGITNVTSNSLTTNWNYSDDDGDVQTQFQVQLSSKLDFSTVDYTHSEASAATSYTFTGINPGEYYFRVKTWNEANGEGPWVKCCSSATTPSNLGQSCGCSTTGQVGTYQCDGTCKTDTGTTIPASCSTCDSSHTQGETCTTTDSCGSVEGTYSCTAYGWSCNPIETRNCDGGTDQCSNLSGIQLTVPDGYTSNGDGTCSQVSSNCPIVPSGSSRCFQLFTEDGVAMYEDSGITQAQYDQYFKEQVESTSYYIDGALVTDHNIYAISTGSSSGCNVEVCIPEVITDKTGCINNPQPASCYSEPLTDTPNVSIDLRAFPDIVPQGEYCNFVWTTQDTDYCNFRLNGDASGTVRSYSTAGTYSVLMGNESITGTLSCQSLDAADSQIYAKQATCRTPGDFSEF